MIAAYLKARSRDAERNAMGQLASSLRTPPTPSTVVVVESRSPAEIARDLDKIYAPWKSATRKADFANETVYREPVHDVRPTGVGSATSYLDDALRDIYADDHVTRMFRRVPADEPVYREALY